MEDHRLEIVLAAKDLSARTIKSFQGRLEGLTRSVFSFQGAVTTLTGAGGLGLIVNQSLSAADALGKTADKLGLSTAALQEYRFAAEQSGVAQQTLDMAMQRFTRRLAEAAQGTGELKGILEQYNIAVRDSSGNLRGNEAVLADLADTLARTDDASERLRISFKAFDSEGAALVNMLRNGSGDLSRMRQEARDLGLVLDEQLIRNSEKASGQLDILGKVISTQVTTAVASFAPQIAEVTGNMTEWFKANREVINQDVAKYLKAGVSAVGGFLKQTKSGWDALPDVIKKIGIVGAVVGGVKGRAALLILVEALGHIKKINKEVAAAAANKSNLIASQIQQQEALLRRLYENLNNSRGDEYWTKKYGEQIQAAHENLKELYLDLYEYASRQKEAAEATESAADAKKNLADASGKAAGAVSGLNKELSRLIDYDVTGAIESFSTQISGAMDQVVGSTSPLSLDILAVDTSGSGFSDYMRAEFSETYNVAIETIQEINADVIKEQEKTYKKADHLHQKFLEDVTDDTYSFLKDIKDGYIDSIGDALDRAYDYYTDMLLRMAAKALAEPIIVPVVQQTYGALFGGADISGSGGSGGGSSTGLITQAGGWAWNKLGLGESFSGVTDGLAGGISGLLSYNLGSAGTTTTMSGLSGATGVSNVGSGYSFTLGNALGAFSLGSLGYTTIGDWIGLPQGQYSGYTAGAGAALGAYGGTAMGTGTGVLAGTKLGAWAGPIGMVIGAVLGGIAGSLFGPSNKKKYMGLDASSYGFETDFTYGETPTLGSEALDRSIWEPQNELDEALLGLKQTVRDTISGTVEGTYSLIDDYLSNLPDELSGTIRDDLIGMEFSLEDLYLKVTRNRGEGRIIEGLEAISDRVFDMMMEGISPVVEGHLSTYLQGFVSDADATLDNLRNDHPLREFLANSSIFNADYSRAEGADFETYASSATEYLTAIEQIQGAWDAVSVGFDRMIKPLSEFETETENVTKAVNASLSALLGLGYSEEALAEARLKGQDAIDAVAGRYATSIDERLTAEINRLTLPDADYKAWQYNQQYLATLAEIDDLGHRKVFEDFEYQYLVDKAKELYDAQLAGIDAVSDALETQGQAQLDQIAEISRGWQDFVGGMSVSDLAPVQSEAGYQTEFNRLLGLAGSGDTTDINALYSYLQSDYLPFMRDYTGGGEDYNSIWDRMMDPSGPVGGLQVDLGAVDIDSAAIGDAVANAIKEELIPYIVRQDDGTVHVHVHLSGQEIGDAVAEQIGTNDNLAAAISHRKWYDGITGA